MLVLESATMVPLTQEFHTKTRKEEQNRKYRGMGRSLTEQQLIKAHAHHRFRHAGEFRSVRSRAVIDPEQVLYEVAHKCSKNTGHFRSGSPV